MTTGELAQSDVRIDRRLLWIVAAFLALEIVYTYRLPRVMDEFTGARYVYLAATSMPYRDFQPPKTVLAYYIESPPLLLVRDHWNGMTWIKIELAVLWSGAFALAAMILRRTLRSGALTAALAVSLIMSTFAERATEVRPDAVAAIFGLLSLLALITRRPALAGALAAASFCSTQKGIYFALAGGLALVATAIRDHDRRSFFDVIRYGVASTGSVAAYFAFWSLLTSPQAVISRVLLDRNIKTIALADLYPNIRQHFWTQTLLRNPFFYAAAAAALLLLIPRWMRRDLPTGIVVPYAAIVAACCIWHRQPWPYFFVFLIPTLFITLAVAFSELHWNRTLAVIVIAGGLLIPLARLPITLTRDLTGFQQATVDTAQRLMQPGDTYLDGTNMLYRHAQAASDFRWIDATTLDEFGRMSEAEQKALADAAAAGRPKLIIWTYRLTTLPRVVTSYLRNHFLPIYGDVAFYAPTISPPRFSVDFDGEYVVHDPVVIDGIPVNGRVKLTHGIHTLTASNPTRLKLEPPEQLLVDQRFAAARPLFYAIYEY